MKPNIIVVMTDQQRADLRAGTGYPLDTMPFLDQWAAGGVDFRRAYTPNPTCVPARVSMFTGRYPSCHRVRTNHNIPDAHYTEDLLDVLRAQGYRTALCGKNHSHRNPVDFDFHACNGHLGNEEGEDQTPEEIAFGQFLTATRHLEVDAPSPGGVEVQHPYRNVSDTLRFIDQTPAETPFFAWVSFAEPHNPYQVPEPYFDLFPPDSLPAIATDCFAQEKGRRYRWLRDRWGEVLGEADYKRRVLRARSNYHGMLRLIDDQFKRLVTGLEERGLTDNTIVVYLSDHGDFAGEYGLIRKGPDLPEVLIRVPMVWRGPGIRALGAEDASCVSLVDLLPTICDLLGAGVPFGCQGRSLRPILAGGSTPAGEFDAAYSESGFSGHYWTEEDALTPEEEGAMGNRYCSFDCLNTWTQCGQVRMVRKGEYKLQIDMMGTGYLYHLAEDPLETRNLWNTADTLAVQADLLAVLAAQMLRASDPLPAPRTRYRVKLHPKGYWAQPFAVSEHSRSAFGAQIHDDPPPPCGDEKKCPCLSASNAL